MLSDHTAPDGIVIIISLDRDACWIPQPRLSGTNCFSFTPIQTADEYPVKRPTIIEYEQDQTQSMAGVFVSVDTKPLS